MVTIQTDSQTSEIAQTGALTAVQLNANAGRVKGYAVQQVITVTTPSAGAFTAAVTDICTKTAHGFKTGIKVRVSNSGGALPTGLSAATDYFVIYLTANTFSLAESLILANAGTAIDITGTGSGTQTVTPTAIAGCNVKLQGSVDGTNYTDLASATNITATVNLLTEKVDPMFDYVRAYFTMTAGQISIVQTTTVKGS